MNLQLLHRRLTVSMGLVSLMAFAGGAGFEPVSALLAAVALTVAWVWQPDSELSLRLERFWLPVAGILVARSLYHVVLVGDDVVIPVVDLLLLLLCAESLRSLEAPNDARLYALTFALLVASSAYRPGILFALAFVSYVALATVALVVGHLRRQAKRNAIRDLVVGRRFLMGMAALSRGVTLIMSGVVFLAFPRLSRGWTSRAEVPATSIVGFADQVSIGSHGSRIYPNPEIVLRVEFPERRPDAIGTLHWRGPLLRSIRRSSVESLERPSAVSRAGSLVRELGDGANSAADLCYSTRRSSAFCASSPPGSALRQSADPASLRQRWRPPLLGLGDPLL